MAPFNKWSHRCFKELYICSKSNRAICCSYILLWTPTSERDAECIAYLFNGSSCCSFIIYCINSITGLKFTAQKMQDSRSFPSHNWQHVWHRLTGNPFDYLSLLTGNQKLQRASFSLLTTWFMVGGVMLCRDEHRSSTTFESLTSQETFPFHYLILLKDKALGHCFFFYYNTIISFFWWLHFNGSCVSLFWCIQMWRKADYNANEPEWTLIAESASLFGIIFAGSPEHVHAPAPPLSCFISIFFHLNLVLFFAFIPSDPISLCSCSL